MIIVDTLLEKRERQGEPIRVAIVGAGHMGRGIALQMAARMPGMRLVAISSRNVSQADRAWREAGAAATRHVETVSQVEDATAQGGCVSTDNPMLLCRAEGIDALIEATGEVEFGARVTEEAIRCHKHVILLNAELDATLGPILKVHADRAGVVITNTDGDEPGVAMNLYRSVKLMGCRPVLAGNIKGFLDPHRTPETQRGFADRVNQKATMITSFADGTKLAMETTILANATGFRVARRGMLGHRCAHVREMLTLFRPEQFDGGGLVDYALGAEPSTGAFVVGYDDHPTRRQYMSYFKMGDGPLYLFYTPYHLPHLQVPMSVARAVLFRDATVAPLGPPVCDAVAVAKRDLTAGELLDGIGGYTCYGVIENSDVCRAEGLLPMGLARDCQLRNNVSQDQAITYSDVQLPEGRLSISLRSEQDRHFS